MKAAPLPDAEVRRRAATDFETNLVVLAGAGTGKTSLLVERVLTAVGSGRVTLDHAAAITFTEKAAGEMRERIAAGLERLRALARDEVRSDPKEEADRTYAYLAGERGISPAEIATRALEAMDQLDRATVMTIHAFCSELLRSHPVEAGVDPGFTVDSGEHAEALREAAWESYVTRQLGPEAERPAEWKSLLARLPLGAIGTAARSLADFGVPQALLDAPFLAAEELFGEGARARIRELDGLLEHRGKMSPTARNYLEGMHEALGRFVGQGLEALRLHFESNPALLQRILGSYAPTLAAYPDQDELKRVSKAARDYCRKLSRIDDALMRQLVDRVSPFALQFKDELLRAGFVSFDGLLALARDLLRDHAAVREQLKRRFDMLLVDEFQDTDPLQYEIVLFLAETPGHSATDAFRCELAPGRLVVVGDTKQSIYRFRGADYTACKRAIDRIVESGGASLDLVGNFRSVPGVTVPVNALFAATDGCWNASEYQPDYVAIEPVRSQDDDEPRVELWSVELPGRPRAEDRREAEGRVIARSIDRLVRREQRCRFEQITILFRAFTRISHYLRPLRELGIPFVVDGGRDFLRRPEVHELMAALRTLAQPADAPALLAYLRSPAGGASDVELAEYAASGGRWDWRTEVDRGSFGRIGECFRQLRELARETRHLPADQVIRKVVERTCLVPLGAAAFEGAQRVANLRKLSAAAGDLARNGRLSLEEVVSALKEGRLADIQTDRPLSDDAAEAVRITSIHRMKGLENDWIFLPDLARYERGGRTDTDHAGIARQPDGRSGLAIRSSGKLNGLCVHHELENRGHEQAEEVRVFYVALTRARERLVVVAGPTGMGAPWLDALAPWGYDHRRRPADGALLCDGRVIHRSIKPEEWRRPEEQASHESARRAVLDYGLAVESLRSSASPPIQAPSALHEDAEPAAARTSASRGLGRATGIVLHRLLQHWDGANGQASRAHRTLCDEVARSEQVERRALERESGKILDAFLASDLADRLRSIETVGREVPLLLRTTEGPVFNGSIDLLYRDRDGRLVVADYKTDRDDDAVALCERYRGQLGIYLAAVTEALAPKLPPRAELWLLRSGRRIEITDEPPQPPREPGQRSFRF